jgi:hypothetical protein
MKSIVVDTVRLDDFWSEVGRPRIDFVKIDVEGAEKLVIDGMRELAWANPALKLVTEVNLSRFSLEELLDSIKLCGFSTITAIELNRNVSTYVDIHEINCVSRYITVNFYCER